MKEPRIWIGTSGWVYKQWAGNFYPKGWPKKDEFTYYARHFPTVEINATFYRLPSLKMVRGWRERAPDRFLFAVKGSRYLTHIRRLNETGAGLKKYFARLQPLRERTGPILWQLPPNFHKNEVNWQRLERFLSKLPRAYRHAIEFRHPSWMDEQTMTLLRRHRATNVWISSLRMPADHAITGDFVYLRFHGLEGGAYHDYTTEELRPWAEQLVKAARKGIPAYVYFNNDLNTRAPLNAHALMELVGQHAVPALAADPVAPRELPPPKKGPETWGPWTRTAHKAAPASSRQSPKSRQTKPAGTRRSASARPKRARQRVTRPGQAGVRRFAAAQFSASALPPTH